MELQSEWFLWIVFAIVVIALFEIWSRNRGLPPGPWGLPFIGYYPFLMSKSHLKLAELSKRHGDIFCFRSLGGKLYVVLHSMPLIREVLVNRADEFIGRSRDTNFLNWFEDEESLGNMEGVAWKEQRKFFLTTVKNFGYGKLEHEAIMHEVIRDMIEDIRSLSGKPLDLHARIAHASCNILSEILCKKRFAKDDPKFLEFRDGACHLLSLYQDSLLFVDGVAYDLYLRLSARGRSARRVVKKLHDFVEDIIEEHIKNFEPDNPKDFIDSYLLQMNTLKKEGKLEGSSFSRKRLKSIFLMMLVEGMETVSVTLYLMLLKLAEHEDVQRKLQREIDDVVGHERLPSWADKPKLPYTEAVQLELVRVTWLFVVSSFYNNFEETTIRGYRIPKRSNIVYSFWEISNNPRNFPNPSKFDPGRFLGPDAVSYRDKSPVPFGIGKRSCPGEAMAQVEVFDIIGALMQNFTLYLGENGAVRAKPRKKNIS